MVKNSKYVSLGASVVTSGIDITGEGWQKVEMKDFGKRVAIAGATWGATELIGNAFSKTSKVGNKGASETTVLGHYPDYVNLSNELGANRFEIPTDVWNKMTTAEQWAANQKFLDRMILRGDKIRLATPLSKVKPGSFFEKELNYLFQNGYYLSNNKLWLIK